MTECPCPHHPQGCYGHPTKCGCARENKDAEIAHLRAVLQYVLDDEPNLMPRATSECRKVIRRALEQGKESVK